MGVRNTPAGTSISLVRAVVNTTSAYDASTDWIVDARGLSLKNLVLKETGGAHGFTYTVLASVDEGVAYDIVDKSDTDVLAGATENFKASASCNTHWLVRVKSKVPASAGTSTSAGAPATTITAGNIQINLDGDGAQTVALHANAFGSVIAADIQAAVRALTAVTPGNQPAFDGFTATFTGGLYVLTSGTKGAASSVVVTDGLTTDRAAALKIGVPNAGTEVAGVDNAPANVVMKICMLSL